MNKKGSITDEIITTGKWFWSDDFITANTNKLLALLQNSYEEFINIISSTKRDKLVEKLMSMNVPRAVLMKHIMIFLDTSAETLDRCAMYICIMKYEQLTLPEEVIKFNVLGEKFNRGLSNANIGKANDNLVRDLINILVFASESLEFGQFESFKKCNLAKLAGDNDKITKHLFFLPLNSSTQIKQLRAVDFGHQLELYIKKALNPLIDELGVTKTSRYNDQSFDLVLKKGNRYVIIEIAFQETTNSTLERKGKQAKNGLYESINKNGDKLIYVIDGAGYFKRKRALEDLITYSHLACNVSESGLAKLRHFLENYFK